MSQRTLPADRVQPAVPWHVEARPRIIALLLLALIGVALTIPRPAPAAAVPAGGILYAISGSFEDPALESFDLRTGKPLRSVYVGNSDGPFSEVLTAVASGSDGHVYLSTRDYTNDATKILRFDGRTGDLLGTLAEARGREPIADMVSSPDGILYVLSSGAISRYRLADGASLGPLTDYLANPYPGPGIPPRLWLTNIALGPGDRLYGLGTYSETWEGPLRRALVRIDRKTGAFVDIFIDDDMRIGGVFAVGPDGTIYGREYIGSLYPESERGLIFRYSPSGVFQGTFSERVPRASSMLFGPEGQLYIRIDRGSFPDNAGGLMRVDPRSGATLGEFPIPHTSIDVLWDFADQDTPITRSFAIVGRAEPPGPTARPVKRAAVGLAQRASPALQALRGELLTVTLSATNRGEGSATSAVIDVPLDPARVDLLDAVASRKQTWVSARRPDGLTIDTGRLGAGDTVSVTLRLRVRPDAPDGPALPGRPSLRWADAGGGGATAANLLAVRVAEQRHDPEALPLTVEPPSAGAGVPRAASGAWLAPGEPVALWYDRPDGSSVALGRAKATAEGGLSYELGTAGLPPGRYTLVAHGVLSGVTLAGAFEVR